MFRLLKTTNLRSTSAINHSKSSIRSVSTNLSSKNINRSLKSSSSKLNSNDGNNNSSGKNSFNNSYEPGTYEWAVAALGTGIFIGSYSIFQRIGLSEYEEELHSKHIEKIFGENVLDASDSKINAKQAKDGTVEISQAPIEEEEDNSGSEVKVFEDTTAQAEAEAKVLEEAESTDEESTQTEPEPEPPAATIEVGAVSNVSSIKEDVDKVKEAVDEVKDIVEEVTEIIEEAKQVTQEVSQAIEKTEQLAKAVKEVVNEVIDDAKEIVKETIIAADEIKQEAVKISEQVEGIVEAVVEEAGEVISAVTGVNDEGPGQTEEESKTEEDQGHASSPTPAVKVTVKIAEELPAKKEPLKTPEKPILEAEPVLQEPTSDMHQDNPAQTLDQSEPLKEVVVQVSAPEDEEKTMFQIEAEKLEAEAKTKLEVDPNQLPDFVEYVLIGGGAASFSAMRAITNRDPGCKILILTDEDYAPYQRPPLSKELWFGNTEESSQSLSYLAWNKKHRSIYMDDEFHFAKPGELVHYEGSKVALAGNCKVDHIVPGKDVIVLEDGRTVRFGKCLIATGGNPKRMEELEGVDEENVTYYRRLSDFKKLERQTREDFSGKTVAVIGGGFLGSEISVALGTQSKSQNFNVVQIIKETGNLGAVLPDYLSEWSTTQVKACNVNVITSSKIESASQPEKGGKIQLNLSNGESLKVDHVIAAVGIEVPKEFAEKSGIEFDNKRGGYVVNSELQAKSNIWAAGDATSFHDIKLGRRRVEHHDHAVVSGRLAGQNMTGANQQFWHQSMFWSDLGPKIGFEAMGLVDSKRYKTVGFFASATDQDTPESREHKKDGSDASIAAAPSKNYGKGVIFYLNKNNIVVGCVTWNIFGRMKTIRKIIADQKKMQGEDLQSMAKMFKIQ